MENKFFTRSFKEYYKLNRDFLRTVPAIEIIVFSIFLILWPLIAFTIIYSPEFMISPYIFWNCYSWYVLLVLIISEAFEMKYFYEFCKNLKPKKDKEKKGE